eukprot:999771-Pyramimonas_sp.AAC.1
MKLPAGLLIPPPDRGAEPGDAAAPGPSAWPLAQPAPRPDRSGWGSVTGEFRAGGAARGPEPFRELD